MYTERHAALHFTATLLQARAVDAAPQCGATQRDDYLLNIILYITREIFVVVTQARVAMEVVIAFLENKRPIQGGNFISN